MSKKELTSEQIQAFHALGTSTISNIIDHFKIRLKNQGYIKDNIINKSSRSDSMIGHAFTIKMRTDNPPMTGQNFPDRNDWWDMITKYPHPRIMVIEDISEKVAASVVGALHGAIFKALQCQGIVTNGNICDIEKLDKMNLHLYSAGSNPSYAYSHIIEVGMPVKIGGLKIAGGDLLHGDRNGIINIPDQIIEEILQLAPQFENKENKIIEFCNSPKFSPRNLRRLISVFNKPGITK